VIATWRLKQAPATVKVLAHVPGVGGLLALRQLDRGASARARVEEDISS
jgi:predicted NAD/FAD-dependent oxidoreductase